MIDKQTKYLLIGGAGLILLGPSISGWLANRAASTAGSALINAAGGAATGAVVAIGQQVGIPETNLTQCQKDTMAGRTWDASFSCPAADWLRYVTNGTIPGNPAGVSGLGAMSNDWKTWAIVAGAVYLMAKKSRKRKGR